ncbi:hypothetical protein BD626DRAFT_472484 [Schizophyllum amplum]|uniref:Uncharacterized protein n=1 Tax=Schizophyllum amplum TaxID=97359 RepID=A0A550CVZ8_9AGAR|nr:hypothetical protein BD626DRAFT_472484 [Auriculariopsis ampla]
MSAPVVIAPKPRYAENFHGPSILEGYVGPLSAEDDFEPSGFVELSFGPSRAELEHAARRDAVRAQRQAESSEAPLQYVPLFDASVPPSHRSQRELSSASTRAGVEHDLGGHALVEDYEPFYPLTAAGGGVIGRPSRDEPVQYEDFDTALLRQQQQQRLSQKGCTMAVFSTMYIMRLIAHSTPNEMLLLPDGALLNDACTRIIYTLSIARPDDNHIMGALCYAGRLVPQCFLAETHLLNANTAIVVDRLFRLCLVLSQKWFVDFPYGEFDRKPAAGGLFLGYKRLEPAALRVLDYNVSIRPAEWRDFLYELETYWRGAEALDNAIIVARGGTPDDVSQSLEALINEVDDTPGLLRGSTHVPASVEACTGLNMLLMRNVRLAGDSPNSEDLDYPESPEFLQDVPLSPALDSPSPPETTTEVSPFRPVLMSPFRPMPPIDAESDFVGSLYERAAQSGHAMVDRYPLEQVDHQNLAFTALAV